MFQTGITKPFKTYEEQLSILESRGLIINDRDFALSILKKISYYRFSAYSLTLRSNDVFYDNVSFENIYDLYCFDELFRSVLLKYCCVVEICFRSYISYYHTEKYKPLGYLDSKYFSSYEYHLHFISDLSNEVSRSDDLFVRHHRDDLGWVFPLWVALEASSFGTLSKLYKNMLKDDRENIAFKYTGYHRDYVENWLQCVCYCRNIAAHGGRFYNRKLHASPVKINKKRYPEVIGTTPYAFVIAIFNLLPSAAMRDEFVSSIESAIAQYPFILLKHIGFPDDWNSLLYAKRIVKQ